MSEKKNQPFIKQYNCSHKLVIRLLGFHMYARHQQGLHREGFKKVEFPTFKGGGSAKVIFHF